MSEKTKARLNHILLKRRNRKVAELIEELKNQFGDNIEFLDSIDGPKISADHIIYVNDNSFIQVNGLNQISSKSGSTERIFHCSMCYSSEIKTPVTKTCSKCKSPICDDHFSDHRENCRGLFGVSPCSVDKNKCASCGNIPSSDEEKLLICGGCNSIKYCNIKCQTANWKLHKQTCKKGKTKK